MEMKTYLIETFRYNDWANRKLLEKIKLLPDQGESVKLFSHLINCMNKWMARIRQRPEVQKMDWWTPLYPLDQLGNEWSNCLQPWISFLENQSDDELSAPVQFTGYDGARWEAKPKDIALQLNYHSIHHRAQIQSIIRRQGLEPDFLDYIGRVYKRLG